MHDQIETLPAFPGKERRDLRPLRKKHRSELLPAKCCVNLPKGKKRQQGHGENDPNENDSAEIATADTRDARAHGLSLCDPDNDLFADVKCDQECRKGNRLAGNYKSQASVLDPIGKIEVFAMSTTLPRTKELIIAKP